MAKRRKQLNGRVAKIIKSVDSSEPDKAQIEIEGADDLYKEIRIENVVVDEKGREAHLETGEHVDVNLETDLRQDKGKGAQAQNDDGEEDAA